MLGDTTVAKAAGGMLVYSVHNKGFSAQNREVW